MDAEESGSGWPLGLEPVHLRTQRLVGTLIQEQNRKVSLMSSSMDTSNLETETSCSSEFFPDDRPVTLGEILGMSLNHLAANSFRSIELHVLDTHGRKTTRGWRLCSCTRPSTSSSRFDESYLSRSLSSPHGRIYTNSIFEHEEEARDSHQIQAQNATTLLDHFRSTGSADNPLFLVEARRRYLSRNIPSL